uniref:Carbohydrate (keratan sulfate Gal-6) sulfotransferase 1 n=1 Tax=Gouania willdenowi TaxID=441366 RepID=A0A8C5D1R9_GOUWI
NINTHQLPAFVLSFLFFFVRAAGCEDYPLFSFNASRKTHILVLATTRSGSSFMGQLLNQHQDVFYLFEPLYHIQTTLIPRLFHSRNMADRRVMLGASRDLLRSLYGCDLYFLESYIKPPPSNHTTDKLFRAGASRALCQPPVCNAFDPADINVEEGDCMKKCAALNLTLAAEACREKRHVAIKIVRVPEIGDLRALVEDPSPERQSHPAGPRPPRNPVITDRDLQGHISPVANLERLLQLSVHGLQPPLLAQGKYPADLRVPWSPRGQEGGGVDSRQHAGSSEPSAKHKFGTVRDSAANAESWRLKLSYDMVEYMQSVCHKALRQLGYRAARSAAELKNMSLSLVQDRTFLLLC